MASIDSEDVLGQLDTEFLVAFKDEPDLQRSVLEQADKEMNQQLIDSEKSRLNKTLKKKRFPVMLMIPNETTDNVEFIQRSQTTLGCAAIQNEFIVSKNLTQRLYRLQNDPIDGSAQ